MEINSHATCVITDGNTHNNEVHLNHLPAVRGDCHENVFINQVQHGVASGCSVRIKIVIKKHDLISVCSVFVEWKPLSTTMKSENKFL